MTINGIAITGKKQHRLIYAVLNTILNIIDAKMKNPDRKTVSRLEELPNIGKAIADDLWFPVPPNRENFSATVTFFKCYTFNFGYLNQPYISLQ